MNTLQNTEKNTLTETLTPNDSHTAIMNLLKSIVDAKDALPKCSSDKQDRLYGYIVAFMSEIIMSEQSAQKSVVTKKIKAREWFSRWLKNYAFVSLRPNTFATYRGYIINHINPHFKDMNLSDITTETIQQFYNSLLVSGRVGNCPQKKGLSPKTVCNMHTLIHSSLEKAIEEKYIVFNPSNMCRLPRFTHREMKTLQPENIGIFLETAKHYGLYELFYTELSLGLRRGELLGLKWSDIDFKKSVIIIRHQIVRQNGKTVETQLKTRNSYRYISASETLMDVLHLKKQNDTTNSEYVFCKKNGEPLCPDSMLGKLHKVLRHADLPLIRFHDLRHTFAMLALQNGVDAKTLSGILGHYSTAFTLDTYGHISAQMNANAAEKVGNYLDGLYLS